VPEAEKRETFKVIASSPLGYQLRRKRLTSVDSLCETRYKWRALSAKSSAPTEARKRVLARDQWSEMSFSASTDEVMSLDLSGIRVLDLCNAMGAYCTRLLADAGAHAWPPAGPANRLETSNHAT
jgi:hypothetical protein